MSEKHEIVLRAPKFIETALEELVVKEGFRIGKFTISYEKGADYGDGFLSILYKARVFEDDDQKERYFMCKISPLSDGQKDHFDAATSFERETFSYREVHPAFYEFQKKKQIDPEIEFTYVPRCYFARYDMENKEIGLIMEDLKHLGYKMWNKANPVDLNHVNLVMKSLGKFHAISLAMKNEEPEMFNRFKVIPDVLTPMFEKEMFAKMMDVQFDKAISALDEGEDLARELLFKYKETYLSDMKFCTDPANAEPYAVVNHGDCWINNFMFYYKENGQADRVKLLDWQISRYASPVLDLLYFIFAGTDEAFRKAHYDDVLKFYHSSLSQYLEMLGGDAKVQFPFENFLQHLKKFGKFGFILGICVVPMICTPKEELVDMEKLDGDIAKLDGEMKFSENAEKNYKIRINGVIKDIIKLGYV